MEANISSIVCIKTLKALRECAKKLVRLTHGMLFINCCVGWIPIRKFCCQKDICFQSASETFEKPLQIVQMVGQVWLAKCREIWKALGVSLMWQFEAFEKRWLHKSARCLGVTSNNAKEFDWPHYQQWKAYGTPFLLKQVLNKNENISKLENIMIKDRWSPQTRLKPKTMSNKVVLRVWWDWLAVVRKLVTGQKSMRLSWEVSMQLMYRQDLV